MKNLFFLGLIPKRWVGGCQKMYMFFIVFWVILSTICFRYKKGNFIKVLDPGGGVRCIVLVFFMPSLITNLICLTLILITSQEKTFHSLQTCHNRDTAFSLELMYGVV